MTGVIIVGIICITLIAITSMSQRNKYSALIEMFKEYVKETEDEEKPMDNDD